MNILLLLLALTGDPADCPMHAQHTQATQVDQRGDLVMGFSHEKTKHTFRMLEDGGAIEVRANDAADAESIAAIRAHLKEIASEFKAGKFAKPEKIHGRMPDGVEVMQAARGSISYEYEELDRGARVRITTPDGATTKAVHSFLEFQIRDHRTGDSTEVQVHH